MMKNILFFFQDIVEGADKPNLTDNSATFDRFGFRIDTSGNSLEDKAEKLRRQAEDHHDQLDEGACQVLICCAISRNFCWNFLFYFLYQNNL